jgi:hypothetical protein
VILIFRDKQALANYVASVESCIVDSDGKRPPPDHPLPIAAATPSMQTGRKSRQSSSLQLVQTLVTVFIEAYNVVVQHLVARQQEIDQLNSTIERLKSEAVDVSLEHYLISR